MHYSADFEYKFEYQAGLRVSDTRLSGADRP